ncbi:hypothetical protein [Asanoa ishikariensis]|uniref:hypothetical protein n=1 Tax=Asanoa ishikariensis TaxID=137265 RepID=UPI00115FB930|nr:hypothetical protein [Asanoa ishikariensis]
MPDVISFGRPDDRPRRPTRWVVVAVLVAVALGAVTVLAFRDGPGPPPTTSAASPSATPAASPTVTSAPSAPEHPGPPCLAVGWGQRPAPRVSVAGLRIDQATSAGSGLDRCDRTAIDGPWAVVVRGPGGSLGRQSAVVTFPAAPLRSGRAVAVGGVGARAASGVVTWPVARKHARVRGDLSDAELVKLAALTRVVDGRPVVDAPAGFTVVASGPYRAPSLHELRYGGADVGEQDTLGALVYTGVTSGGWFEDQLYTEATRDGGTVDGQPAVLSGVAGGSATLAWEPAPGLVAFVGYSGGEPGDAALAALGRLAERTRVLDTAAWKALAPVTADQAIGLG